MDRGEQNFKRTVGAMKKSGKLWIALVAVALGVALLAFGGEWSAIFGDREDEALGNHASSEGDTRLSMEEYRLALEARVCQICAKVAGAGEVFAVVNLGGGFEYVYASDVKNTSGGISSEYIVIGSGDGERVVYLTERVPEITGIGIVCAGGNDLAVRQEVTALVAAAFGIGSHKIYVTGAA